MSIDKKDKYHLAVLSACLIFLINSMLKLCAGAEIAFLKPAYKPMLWFTVSIQQLLLCIGVFIFRYVLSKDDDLKRLLKGPFRKIQLVIMNVFGLAIIAISVPTKNITPTLALGITLIVGSLLVFIYGKKMDI